MKRQILTIAAVLALVFAGAVFAQSSQNTTAPGPTTQQEPGLTNNNLPNPGNPIPQPGEQTEPVMEQGTVEGTATESIEGEQGANTTGTVTSGSTGTGTVNTGTETGTSSEMLNEDQSLDTTTTADDTDTLAGDSDTLPATAGELPTVALIGLLAFGAFFLVRARRNA
jgi:hypothetical protein